MVRVYYLFRGSASHRMLVLLHLPIWVFLLFCVCVCVCVCVLYYKFILYSLEEHPIKLWKKIYSFCKLCIDHCLLGQSSRSWELSRTIPDSLPTICSTKLENWTFKVQMLSKWKITFLYYLYQVVKTTYCREVFIW